MSNTMNKKPLDAKAEMTGGAESAERVNQTALADQHVQANQTVRVNRGDLEQFCTSVFSRLGMTESEAEDSAKILTAADARGIASHGVARLWRYVNGISNGIMQPTAKWETVHATTISEVIDARGSIGLSLSRRVMSSVIDRARDHGFATAAVRDSNHFGIAGYYAMMALPQNMIGIAMTNTAALAVPTFGREAHFGTNPIAVAVPAGTRPPFVLDMASTVVTRGKIEGYEREGKPLPVGWAVDAQGAETSDADRLLQDMLHQLGGGILPLGGAGERFGGHKGFGLGALVDIMTAVASGGVFGKAVMDSQETSARVCHFFAALRIDLFRPAEAFQADMDRLLGEYAEAKPAAGCSRVYYAGLKEHEFEQECAREGVPITNKVWESLQRIGKSLDVILPEPRLQDRR